VNVFDFCSTKSSSEYLVDFIGDLSWIYHAMWPPLPDFWPCGNGRIGKLSN
jgi:hypothetical protein